MGSQQGQRQPQLGATFYPGGADDFYMPEVISPAPQRVTPEVPERMQDNLTLLELEAAPVNRLSGLVSPGPMNEKPGKPATMNTSFPSRNSSVSNYSVLSPQTANQEYSPEYPIQPQGAGNPYTDLVDQPTFSPFPPIRNRPANVPPSDEEKEAILESARGPVLNSDDPEMQLSWAQDALAWVEIAAQNEARVSENRVGRPRTPHIEHQLRVDAINVVSFLADQHHPKAEFMRGMWLEFGKFDIRMDKKEAFRCYQRAAQKGYARAEYRMGMQFESSNEPDKAIKHYLLGVKAGDSASSYRFGMMTLLGQHGQRLDYQRGVELIRYAAQTADENAPQGAYVHGMLQAHDLPQVNLPDQCLPLDIAGARFNIEKAAYLGFAKAQTKMGLAYELCQLGCDFNPALSLHYNALAAKQGEPDADMAISKWFLCGYEGIFEKSEELAFTYAQRAAQSGLATAEFALGYFYEIGIYVPVNLKESRSWYEKAAEHGNKDAAARIDGISRAKTLSRKDHENVAVAKIQSQYGSHRGRRPDRFKNAPTPMPTISDDPIDMPEPKIPQTRPGQPQPYAYRTANGPAPRPVSIAPYPVDDTMSQPQSRPGPGPGYPTPAVSTTPGPRPPSTAASESSFGDNNFRGSGYPQFPTARPYVAGDNVGAGRGRGAPVRVPENIAAGRGRGGLPNGPVAPPGAQGYRQPGPGRISPRPPNSPAMNASRPPPSQPPTQVPAIDIGFSAPPDPSGADSKRRQQRIDNANMPQPSAMPKYPNNDGQGGRRQDRVGSLPHPSLPHPSLSHPQSMPALNNTASSQGRPVPAGRPGVSLQDAVARPGSAASLPIRPPKTPNPDIPAATPPPTVPAVAKPPGKGPKTFQEMGVPATKNESDCLVM